ncbi:FkbM family methyltransferase [Mesorhizobium sp. KR1-2]|uniref:FkbM family methyltransferase n=1 Tax=Mesorhizobium sp. KR1-2 TaxID=3156609 RepID=UPI0032B51656
MDGSIFRNLVPPRIRATKDALKSWYGGEPELRLLPHICARDELAIDIGANRGVYSWHLRRWASGVVAFEPLPEMVRALERAFGSSVRIEAVALSDADGTATLRIPSDRMLQGCATIEEENVLGGEVAEIRVPRRRLDGYRFDRVAVIKIDVEGHELAVLKGACALLARDHPTLIVEAEERHREGALESICDYLSTWDYQGFVLWGGRLQPLNEISGGSDFGREAAKQGIYNFVFAARDDVIERMRILHARRTE